MRVKFGNVWHEATLHSPLMVELTEADKNNIARMHPEATKYAEFHDDTPLSKAERFDWMEAVDEDTLKCILHYYVAGTHKTGTKVTPLERTTHVLLGGNHRLQGHRWDEIHVHLPYDEVYYKSVFPDDLKYIQTHLKEGGTLTYYP